MKKRIIMVILASFAGMAANCQSKSNNPKEMKQFSLLVRVPVNYAAEQVKSAGIEWDALLAKWKADGIYVISFAFPGDSYVISGQDHQTIHASVLTDNLRVVSNIVLRATSIQEACELAKQFPVLKYGGNVEVREIPKPILTEK